MEAVAQRGRPASPSRLVGRGVLAWALAAVLARCSATHPETPWDARIDEACCAYPEHDPRDYNWPYSQYAHSFLTRARAPWRWPPARSLHAHPRLPPLALNLPALTLNLPTLAACSTLR